jgi:hypothetical protein
MNRVTIVAFVAVLAGSSVAIAQSLNRGPAVAAPPLPTPTMAPPAMAETARAHQEQLRLVRQFPLDLTWGLR